MTRPASQVLDAFFFPTEGNLRLFGVARGPQNASRVWLLCPPFAEEEKGSRRLFTLVSQSLAARGAASLLFSFSGTGDSEGDLAGASLLSWRRDIEAAAREAKARFPAAAIALLGVRLGASLAWQEAQNLGANRLILIEPLLAGRSFLMQQTAKKQIRAQLTGETGASIATGVGNDDLDGWELGEAMKSEFKTLDLRREPPGFSNPLFLLQVGPKPEIAPPLLAISTQIGAAASAVVMPPFWNLIDAPDFSPLLQAIESAIFGESL